jgi:hypothetical protein
MVCVDQAKAFDSVNHEYMAKVFRFFNFGPNFIRWLCTIGTGRKAYVILSGGKTSTVFDLLKGTAQGDCSSPIIYNICAQILSLMYGFVNYQFLMTHKYRYRVMKFFKMKVITRLLKMRVSQMTPQH